MDRKKRISLKGQIIASERYENHLKQIRDRYSKEQGHLNVEYLKMWRSLLNKVARQQSEREKGKTQYLVISLLHSSFLTRTYEFRFDVYDKNLYLDPTESCAYWSPSLFFDDIDGDFAYFSSKIKKEIIQVTDAELEEFELEYAYRFVDIAFSYFGERCEDIFRLDEYQDMEKENKVYLLFGTYIGKTLVLAVNPKEAV